MHINHSNCAIWKYYQLSHLGLAPIAIITMMLPDTIIHQFFFSRIIYVFIVCFWTKPMWSSDCCWWVQQSRWVYAILLFILLSFSLLQYWYWLCCCPYFCLCLLCSLLFSYFFLLFMCCWNCIFFCVCKLWPMHPPMILYKKVHRPTDAVPF